MATASVQARFGRAIRRRRERDGISQEDLADAAGIHRTYVSMLERGTGNPSLAVVENLARALDTSMASLFREVEGGAEG